MKLVLVGRSRAGKTKVIESILGCKITSNNQSHKCSRFGSEICIVESPGFFAQDENLEDCRQRLASCVRPNGTDVFCLVIRIGRFTQEEQAMVDVLQETFGEDVFRFTVLIFTGLDDLDDGCLDEFLTESPPRLLKLLEDCDRRYVGFDNTKSFEIRKRYAEQLVSVIHKLRKENSNAMYTVNMVEEAAEKRRLKEEEAERLRDEIHRKRKEELKAQMRIDLQDEIRREVELDMRQQQQDERVDLETEDMTSSKKKNVKKRWWQFWKKSSSKQDKADDMVDDRGHVMQDSIKPVKQKTRFSFRRNKKK